MLPPLEINLGTNYRSASQRARVMSEPWVKQHIPCPLCQGSFTEFLANQVSVDLFCNQCDEVFQLKAVQKKLPKRLTGANYPKTKQTFEEGAHPHLLLLVYDPKTWEVLHLYFIHRKYLTIEILIPRKKLEPPARRAGWQGCYWDFRSVPEINWIKLI